MKLNKLISSTFCLALLSSCATYNTTPYSTNDQVVTNVTLSKANFKVIKQVIGTSEQNYVFGIGGFGKKNSESNSRFEMFKDADLKDNQCVINIATNTSTTQILFVTTKKSVTTGTVIEFIPTAEERQNASYSSSNTSNTIGAKPVNFENNESKASSAPEPPVKVGPSLVGFPVPIKDLTLGSKAIISDSEYIVERIVTSGGLTTIKLVTEKGSKTENRIVLKCTQKRKEGLLQIKIAPKDLDVSNIQWYFK
ncbi:MAG: hypothetical protein MJY63_01665 [Paludibacteraceae bacterium]|nr:hypothetical protein [Paludibacteraceae bacterium]